MARFGNGIVPPYTPYSPPFHSVLKCGLTLFHRVGECVAHMSTPEACPTRIRKVLRLVAPLAPVPKA